MVVWCGFVVVVSGSDDGAWMTGVDSVYDGGEPSSERAAMA